MNGERLSAMFVSEPENPNEGLKLVVSRFAEAERHVSEPENPNEGLKQLA